MVSLDCSKLLESWLRLAVLAYWPHLLCSTPFSIQDNMARLRICGSWQLSESPGSFSGQALEMYDAFSTLAQSSAKVPGLQPVGDGGGDIAGGGGFLSCSSHTVL